MKPIPSGKFKKTKYPLKKIARKDVNIANIKEKEILNYSEVSHHTGQNCHCQTLYKRKCWRGCADKEALLHCSSQCTEVHPIGRTVIQKYLRTQQSNT